MKKEYHSEIFSVRLLAQNIVEVTIHKHQIFDTKHVHEVKMINKKLTGNKPYGYIGIKNEFAVITKQAKILMASEKIAKNTVAKALIIQGLSDRILANFYLKINKPFTQTKVFTNKNEAIKWLEKMLSSIKLVG